MVTVTERAKEKLKEMLQNESDDPSVGLRLATAPSGEIGIFPDRERDDDHIVEHHGSAVLMVGQEMANPSEMRRLTMRRASPVPHW